ncbi:MAG TPA: hypothetical protein DEQ14_08385, partial [Treponema sp.]|nr:hypothetical protein [Treponema sp.]
TVVPVNGVTIFSPIKIAVGSFDIGLDTNSFTSWSSSRSAGTNDIRNGPIGTFILYADGSWEILEPEEGLVGYVIPFDPENDSFFDALEWGTIPSEITDFLANESMVADVPLTVSCPMYVENHAIYASYTMCIRISGNGVELLWSADDVDVILSSISYVPLSFTVVPVNGVCEGI